MTDKTKKLKVLHISFHQGCQNEIQYLSEKLNFDLTFMEYHDGISKGNDKYNVTREKAINSWNLHKDFYTSFDIIITSDTCPISRIFLQNENNINYNKIKIIIWICNRFDYYNHPSKNFPDPEYYTLINGAPHKPNVKIIGYTPFENYYANSIKRLNIGKTVIKPIGKFSKDSPYNSFTSTQLAGDDDNMTIKKSTFIIGPYHNDNIMMNLKDMVKSLGIKVHNGRYNGPKDLAEFAGVIHIPYAWSNLALFEAIQLGIPYFIPSLRFIKYLIHKPKAPGCNFFWSPPLKEEVLELSEWYTPEHQDILIYFDSWAELKNKANRYINNSDGFRDQHIEKLKIFSQKHEENMLNKWRSIIF